ncbi:T9SS type A sorting domain-containing protein [Rufibacter sp. LB8]|nr:T9SS type A sorting domain-containing protein [Rufibacter sp. LB8]
MKKRLTSVLPYLVCVLLFSGCSQENSVTFEAPFPKPNKDLRTVLGSEFSLRNGEDTIHANVIFSKNHNLIQEKATGDTIFYGKASKYRGLYFLSQQMDDSSYHIFAVQVKGTLVFGLTHKWNQLAFVRENILQGSSPNLVTYLSTDSAVLRLKPDKKGLLKLYKKSLSVLPPDTLLAKPNNNQKNAPTYHKHPPVSTDAEELEIATALYPNPFSDFLQIDFPQRAQIAYALFDLNGKIVLHGNSTGGFNRLDTKLLPPGVYVLQVKQNQKIERLKIIKR